MNRHIIKGGFAPLFLLPRASGLAVAAVDEITPLADRDVPNASANLELLP